MSLDRILGASAAVRREAIRRDAGEARDPRFDVPIAMLLDLADDLFGPAALPSRDVDVLVEEIHAGRDSVLAMACTNDAACEDDFHLPTCPRRG